MRRSLRLAFAGMAIVGLTLMATASAGAQEQELGFEVDATTGAPGDVVNGQVDLDDVAELCTTDIGAFQQHINEFGTQLVGRFPDAFLPQNNEDVVAFIYAVIALGVLFDPEIAEDVLAQTFIITFAHIATEDPVGDPGNFDLATGEGSVVVPDIDPGLWGVAAACVSPSLDPEIIQGAVSETAPFVEEALGLPADPWPAEFDFEAFFAELFPGGIFDPDFLEFVAGVAPELFGAVVEPDATGAQLFCILDADGVCPPPAPAPWAGGSPPWASGAPPWAPGAPPWATNR